MQDTKCIRHLIWNDFMHCTHIYHFLNDFAATITQTYQGFMTPMSTLLVPAIRKSGRIMHHVINDSNFGSKYHQFYVTINKNVMDNWISKSKVNHKTKSTFPLVLKKKHHTVNFTLRKITTKGDHSTYKNIY